MGKLEMSKVGSSAVLVGTVDIGCVYFGDNDSRHQQCSIAVQVRKLDAEIPRFLYVDGSSRTAY